METIHKRFDLQITASGSTVAGKFELDKTVKTIVGIVITSDREDLMFYRGEQKIEINGKLYFTENYESKLLMMSLNINANLRYYRLKKVAPGNGIIQFTYNDKVHPKVAFAAYRVSLYVECGV